MDNLKRSLCLFSTSLEAAPSIVKTSSLVLGIGDLFGATIALVFLVLVITLLLGAADKLSSNWSDKVDAMQSFMMCVLVLGAFWGGVLLGVGTIGSDLCINPDAVVLRLADDLDGIH